MANDMVRTIFLNRRVVDEVESTRDLDQFTCASRGIEDEFFEREPLGCSALGLRLRGSDSGS